MKILLLTIATMLALSFPHKTLAENAHANWQPACKLQQLLAEQVMRLRQAGTAMSDVMDIAAKDPAISEAATLMVIAAYKEPRYMGEEMQQRSIEDFSNDAYLRCAQAASR